MIPGRTLHRFASRICCATTVERIVEPAIADLQKEFAEAAATGRVRYAWPLLRGYLAILQVIGMCALGLPSASDGEREAIARTLAFAAVLTTVFTVFLMLPPLTIVDGSVSKVFLMGLIPQAVPLAMPLGLSFGIAFGLARRAPAHAVTRVILLCAVLASLVSFATMGWIMPAANQAWRESVARTKGVTGPLVKGAAEMTFSELDREATVAASAGDVKHAGSYAWSFHLRFALAGASVVLAGFLLATGVTSVAARGFMSLGACFAYWALIYAGESLAVAHGTLPPFAGAWLPNVILTLLAMLIACWRPTFDAEPQSRRERSDT